MKGTLEFDRAGEVDSVIIEFEFEPDCHGVEITNVADIEDYMDRNIERWLKAGEIETWASQAEYEACEAEYQRENKHDDFLFESLSKIARIT